MVILKHLEIPVCWKSFASETDKVDNVLLCTSLTTLTGATTKKTQPMKI
jgi:hypothetical protein